MNENDTFYTDHWRDIEPERISRYEALFQFRDEQQPFIDALQLSGTERILDFGCGPGYMAEAIASHTSGEVIGADLNAEFISRASARGTASNARFFHLNDVGIETLGHFDRIFCKNVLEYVPDMDQTLASFHDALSPGGRALLIDSDWRFVLVEPWGSDRTDAFFKAASGAFKEPEAGRKLAGSLSRAGFTDIHVRVQAGVDREGRGLAVVRNMASYIQTFGTMKAEEVNDMLTALEAAIETGEFMFVLPQFIVTGSKS